MTYELEAMDVEIALVERWTGTYEADTIRGYYPAVELVCETLRTRSAQLEAVLVKCSELEDTDNIVARAFAEEFRRAIEDAS